MNTPMIEEDNLVYQLLFRRYLAKDAGGQVIETPDQMYRRVALVVANAERQYGAAEKDIQTFAETFYGMMMAEDFLPNSPTLMNAGRPNGLLSACFVLPVPDDIVGIFDAVKATALVQKAGGGTGFTFDCLRPTGDIVASSGGVTSGPVSFMRVFAEVTNAIQQGAHRRGANMGLMSLHHPDILKFITAKRTESDFSNFNLSIKVSDGFMRSLKTYPGVNMVVTNPRTGQDYVIPRSINIQKYGLDGLCPLTSELEDRLGEGSPDYYRIGDLWELIVQEAHATGEPGIIFIDRVNQDNPTPQAGTIEATNPCGEQPLLDYEACNLGSINLSRFIAPEGRDLDWDRLAITIRLAIHFLDNVIDVNTYPIPEIKAVTLANRKIGLGIMGFADCLVLLKIRYDSDQALALAARLSEFVQSRAHQASQDLAEARGSFPNWPGSIWDFRYHRPMRNATCTTIAPTGSISLIAGCSSGIEPIYSLASRRIVLNDQEFVQLHPLLERMLAPIGGLDEKARNALMEGHSPRTISAIPAAMAEALVTAHEVLPVWHVKMAAAFQKYTDNAVSKTVNLPAGATIPQVHEIFTLAHTLGCKGITVYRDGSRPQQTLSSAAKPSSAISLPPPRPRPKTTTGQTFKYRMGCGTLFVTVNRDDQGPCEVFANLGKAGGCPSQSEATCRVVSAALRSGVDPKVLVEQLREIRCLSAIRARKNGHELDVLSCPDAIARAIEEAIGDIDSKKMEDQDRENICDVCGYRLRRTENCRVCDRCGESKCG